MTAQQQRRAMQQFYKCLARLLARKVRANGKNNGKP
jgi:hypothetical protein